MGNPAKDLEKLQKESPEFLKATHVILSRWSKDEEYLVALMARGLREMYERGRKGLPPVLETENITEEKVRPRTRPVAKPAPEPEETHAPARPRPGARPAARVAPARPRRSH